MTPSDSKILHYINLNIALIVLQADNTLSHHLVVTLDGQRHDISMETQQTQPAA